MSNNKNIKKLRADDFIEANNEPTFKEWFVDVSGSYIVIFNHCKGDLTDIIIQELNDMFVSNIPLESIQALQPKFM